MSYLWHRQLAAFSAHVANFRARQKLILDINIIININMNISGSSAMWVKPRNLWIAATPWNRAEEEPHSTFGNVFCICKRIFLPSFFCGCNTANLAYHFFSFPSAFLFSFLCFVLIGVKTSACKLLFWFSSVKLVATGDRTFPPAGASFFFSFR